MVIRGITIVGVFVAGLVAGAALPALHAREAGGGAVQAPPPSASVEQTAWYFYRVKWGFQDEFLDLFQKNHYPVLKAQMPGRITRLKVYAPTYHGDGRADWTVAVAITFKDVAAFTGPSPDEAIQRKLFTDWSTFQKEERRRFEILDAHWDTPLNEINLDARRPSR